MSFVSGFFGLLAQITWLQWTGTVLALVLTVYWYLTRNYGVYEKKGLYGLKPEFIFGNTKALVFGGTSLMDFHVELYKKFEGHK